MRVLAVGSLVGVVTGMDVVGVVGGEAVAIKINNKFNRVCFLQQSIIGQLFNILMQVLAMSL